MRFGFLSFILSFSILSSCNPQETDWDPVSYPDSEEYGMMYPEEVDSPVVPEDHPAITCMIKKAHQIADIPWIPLNPIPSLTNEWTPAGTKMFGIPYSSVKEKDKFVGLEVSFYTFMSAVNNPRSVIYTEDVKMPPYVGENCGLYYGTVCSMAVNYALGIDRPIESKMYSKLPYIAKVKQQNPDGVCPGDILWSKGHVVLVLEIKRDESGTPLSFSILESSGSTRIKTLSISAFEERWEKVGWVLYRYMKLAENLSYEPIPFVINSGDPSMTVSFNPDLCTSRGEKAAFLKGEDVTINIFNSSFDTIELYHNNILMRTSTISRNIFDYTFSNLPGGMYSVRLLSDTKVSEPVLFEIIGEMTTVSKVKNSYCISFGSDFAEPEYIVICSRDGNRDAVIDLSDADKMAGYRLISGDYRREYLKVFYRGKYGRVSNYPILL